VSEIVQIAGGYQFGICPGTLYSVIGILVGSSVTANSAAEQRR
jgi:uncharacterized membrane protein YdjX (TVP38/TMEM64 family)